MACARKVYSYGVKKKGGNDVTPWAGMIKDETKKETKLPLKKGVWSKVTTGKTITHPVKNVFDDNYDPFELPDDMVDNDEDNDDDDEPAIKDKINSPKKSNSVKSRSGEKNQSQNKESIPEKTKPQEKLKKCDSESSLQNDVQKTCKTIYGSPKTCGATKSKIFGKPLPQNSVTISSEELKLFGSPRKSDECSSPDKNGRKVSKLLPLSQKKSPVVKAVGRPAKINACKSKEESEKSSKQKKVNVKNGPSKVDKKCVKLTKKAVSQKKVVSPKKAVTPKKTVNAKKQVMKNSKIIRGKKGKDLTPKKISPKKITPKKNAKGKVEVKKTMLDVHKVSPTVRITKTKIDGNIIKCKNQNSKANSILKVKSPGSKQQSKEKNLSVQFVDDNTVLEIKPKDVKHLLKDDIIFSNESSDSSASHLTEEDQDNSSENDIDIFSSDESKVKSRSLFSYYDRHNSQINPNLNGDLKEFEFSTIEDNHISEETSEDKNSLPLKRLSSEEPEPSASAAKKIKQDDIVKGDVFDIDDKEDFDMEDSSGHLKDQKKSPFKSLKQKKNFRRISSLPTNVTVEEEEIEEDIKSALQTPPPLYRSNIFGFGKSVTSPVGVRVRVRRDEKELYTVVRDTKHAHECLEYGESQQFKDDLEYLLDGLKSKHNVSTRCLSALELASKCLTPEFRMHIKAHGLIESIFTFLEDAFCDEQLLVCASMIMYVLAKDKLKINFNKKTIGFMLQVITTNRADVSKTQAYERIMKKIRAIFEKLEDVDIDLDSIDAKTLAREALLSLTVKRTGEWFKDEIRVLGGLDDIAEQVYVCSKCIQKRTNVDQNCVQLKRCLSLFIDMTYKSTVNQGYLVTCRNSVVVESCLSTLHFSIAKSLEDDKEVSTAVAECLMSIQLLLMNLSHENTNACLKICKQENGLSSILRSALHLSQHLPSHLAYENTIVSLCLLVNLVANNPQNRTTLNKTVTREYSGITLSKKKSSKKLIHPVEALMQMFLLHAEACKEADLMQELEKLEQEENEQNAGRLYQDDEYGLTCGDKFEDTIEDEKGENQDGTTSKEEPAKGIDGPLNENEKRDIQSTLDKAQRHMEDSHLAAYTALLIGLLIEGELGNQELVHSLLPEGDFSLLLDSIEKIVSFMQMTHPLSKNDHQTMQRILEVIRTCNEQFKEKG